jgi:hypothetical protein
VYFSHGCGKIKYKEHNIFVMQASSYCVWDLSDEMDFGNGEFQEQHRNQHTIMGVCVDLRMGFPSSTLLYSYVGSVEIYLNKNSWGKEILGKW